MIAATLDARRSAAARRRRRRAARAGDDRRQGARARARAVATDAGELAEDLQRFMTGQLVAAHDYTRRAAARAVRASQSRAARRSRRSRSAARRRRVVDRRPLGDARSATAPTPRAPRPWRSAARGEGGGGARPACRPAARRACALRSSTRTRRARSSPSSSSSASRAHGRGAQAIAKAAAMRGVAWGLPALPGFTMRLELVARRPPRPSSHARWPAADRRPRHAPLVHTHTFGLPVTAAFVDGDRRVMVVPITSRRCCTTRRPRRGVDRFGRVAHVERERQRRVVAYIDEIDQRRRARRRDRQGHHALHRQAGRRGARSARRQLDRVRRGRHRSPRSRGRHRSQRQGARASRGPCRLAGHLAGRQARDDRRRRGARGQAARRRAGVHDRPGARRRVRPHDRVSRRAARPVRGRRDLSWNGKRASAGIPLRSGVLWAFPAGDDLSVALTSDGRIHVVGGNVAADLAAAGLARRDGADRGAPGRFAVRHDLPGRAVRVEHRRRRTEAARPRPPRLLRRRSPGRHQREPGPRLALGRSSTAASRPSSPPARSASPRPSRSPATAACCCSSIPRRATRSRPRHYTPTSRRSPRSQDRGARPARRRGRARRHHRQGPHHRRDWRRGAARADHRRWRRREPRRGRPPPLHRAVVEGRAGRAARFDGSDVARVPHPRSSPARSSSSTARPRCDRQRQAPAAAGRPRRRPATSRRCRRDRLRSIPLDAGIYVDHQGRRDVPTSGDGGARRIPLTAGRDTRVAEAGQLVFGMSGGRSRWSSCRPWRAGPCPRSSPGSPTTRSPPTDIGSSRRRHRVLGVGAAPPGRRLPGLARRADQRHRSRRPALSWPWQTRGP